jgi:hypothetical protein
MNKLKILAVILSVGLLGVGCDDFLLEKPQGQISPETFFNDAEDAEATLIGAYDALQSSYYYGRYIFPSNYHAGCIAYSRSGSRTPIAKYQDNQILNQSRSNKPIWRGFYEGIKRTNTVFKYVPNIAMDDDEKTRILGEAYFLRGMHYLNLVRYFGSVPIVLELAEGANINDYLYEKSPVADVYKQVISDFEEAIKRLDDISATGPGRASVQGAKAMLMRTYWAKAVDAKAKQDSDWTKARDLGEELLTAFTLEPDYANLFSLDNADNDEVLFEVNHMNNLTESLGSAVHRTLAPEHSNIGNGAWGTAHARIHFWNTFLDTDVRKEVTFLTEYTDNDGTVVKWWEYKSAKAPHFKKWIDFESQEATNPYNIPVVRGADILLMLAEIENELNGGPNTKAYGYIDQVRGRAKISLLEGANLTVEAFRDSVLYERRRELACEAHEFVDLARYGADKMEAMAILTSYPNTEAGKQKMLMDLPVEDREAILASDDPTIVIDGIFGQQLKTEDIEWDDHNVKFAIPQEAVDINPKLAKDDPYRPGN